MKEISHQKNGIPFNSPGVKPVSSFYLYNSTNPGAKEEYNDGNRKEQKDLFREQR